MSEPFIGEIRQFPYGFAPRSWAWCEGQLLPIVNYTALFSILGTTYGGDGRTTFGLPNLQGRVPMGWGSGPGLTPRRLGESTGVTEVTLTETQIPAHSHPLTAVSDLGDTQTPTGAHTATVFRQSFYAADSNTLADMNEKALGATGAQSHENMQPYLSVHFCIALEGLYPSRN